MSALLQKQRLSYSTVSSHHFNQSLVTTLGSGGLGSPRRTFFTAAGKNNPFSRALRELELKRLERESAQDPSDPHAHYQFLRELAVDHAPAVVARLRHPGFKNYAVNVPIAVLYLQALMQTGQVAQLDLEDLCERLVQSQALPHDLVSEVRKELASQKISKVDQANLFLNFLTTGRTPGGTAATTASAFGAPMTAAMGSMATSAPWAQGMMGGGGYNLAGTAGAASLLGGRGIDPKQPLFVQLSKPGSARGAILGFVSRAALMLVAFSAVGALMDERGLGRGMGMSGSKHIQEAEQDGRKIKFDDVKGVEEAKQELEEIVMCKYKWSWLHC